MSQEYELPIEWALCRELEHLRSLVRDAEKFCTCGRKDGGHTFAGGQHHNGPCDGDRVRVEVNGMMVKARHRIWEINRILGPDWPG